ncbi:hypothetical protein EVAR_46933_1 [Eumeta japonica]|uniref:Uncharacterized protein n=1 Tax=Eumeta variegata TaxID=151549 RepID=A0A4C2A0A5_EUMVA|nr:hypothetical protein EVAR_46933_1 [Eumeta japonica]
MRPDYNSGGVRPSRVYFRGRPTRCPAPQLCRLMKTRKPSSLPSPAARFAPRNPGRFSPSVNKVFGGQLSLYFPRIKYGRRGPVKHNSVTTPDVSCELCRGGARRPAEARPSHNFGFRHPRTGKARLLFRLKSIYIVLIS